MLLKGNQLYVLLVACAVILYGCTSSEDRSGSNSRGGTVGIELYLSEDEDVRITARESAGDMLTNLQVEIDGNVRSFPWENESNPSYYPEVWQLDINQDNEKEVMINLSLGHGTEVKSEALHVLKRDFTEINVEDPIQALSLIDMQIDKEQERLIVQNGNLSHSYPLPAGVEWFDQPHIGNVINYERIDNQVIVEVPIQVSITHFPATLIGRYQFVNGAFSVAEVELMEN